MVAAVLVACHQPPSPATDTFDTFDTGAPITCPDGETMASLGADDDAITVTASSGERSECTVSGPMADEVAAELDCDCAVYRGWP